FGRVTQQTDPSGALATYGYNGAGLQTSAKDALGHTSNVVFNARGEASRVTEAANTPAQRSFQWIYDAAGQDILDYNANLHTTGTGYDAAGRPQSSSHAYGTAT